MQKLLRAATRSVYLRPGAARRGFAPALTTNFRAPHPNPRSVLHAVRWNSTAADARPLPHKPAPHRNPDEPIYQLTFTCKVCQDRSSHTISKQGYHRGTVLITCTGCKNKHLIADHLKIFTDKSTTIEDIMKDQGEDVQRGSITPDGDVEFWAEDAEAQAAGPRTAG